MRTPARTSRRIRLILLVAPVMGCALAAASLLQLQADSGGTAVYWNRRWNFCIDYPSAWVPYEPFDRSGVELRASGNRASTGVISVGGLPTQAREDDPSKLQTPLEQLEWALQEMGRSDEVQVLKAKEKGSREVAGHPGANVTFSYRDHSGSWLAKELNFAQGEVTFSLGLKERREDQDKFEPVFERVVQSFRLDCRSAH